MSLRINHVLLGSFERRLLLTSDKLPFNNVKQAADSARLISARPAQSGGCKGQVRHSERATSEPQSCLAGHYGAMC